MKYHLAIPDNTTQGPDGLGPFVGETVTWDKPKFQEVLSTLQTDATPPPSDTLAMKRGVRAFLAYYYGTPNLLLLAEDFHRKHEGLLSPDLLDVVPVACHFGRTVRPYLRARLRHHRVLDGPVDWSRSSFYPVRTSNFINVLSTVPESAVKPEDVLHAAGEDIAFSDAEAYRAQWRANLRHKYVPRSLTLTYGKNLGAFELTSGLDFFSERWVEAITNAATVERPAGLIFLPEKIEVTC